MSNRKLNTFVFTVVALSLCVQIAFTQEATVEGVNDTLRAAGRDMDSMTGTTGRDRAVRSPAIALSLSALLPGAGQIYNGSYWKVPIIWGVGGYFVYAIVVLDEYYQDFRNRYGESITEQNPAGNRNLRFIRDAYRDQRDRFAWYMGFLYIINLLDAYVDATLSGFDVGEDLTIRLMPVLDFHGNSMLRIQISF